MTAGDVRQLDPDVLVAAIKKLRPLDTCGPVTIVCVGDHAPHLRALVAALNLPAVVAVDDALADKGESITLRGWKPPDDMRKARDILNQTVGRAAQFEKVRQESGAYWRGFDKYGRARAQRTHRGRKR
jgi:hypothetical protein